MPYCIYIHTSPSNKSYIGLTKNYEVRCNCHKKPSNRTAFGYAIRKYGWEAFSHDILHSDIETLEEAKILEIHYIQLHNTVSPHGYNLTYGGEGIKSEYAIIKTKETLLEKYGVDNPGKLDQSRNRARERMTVNNPGKHDEETINKMRETLVSRMKEMTVEERSEKFGSHGFYGKKHTEESIQKMSVANEKYEYILVSPEGTSYTIKNLYKFCKEHALNRDILMKYINKGVVPIPRNYGKETRMNSVGWEIILN